MIYLSTCRGMPWLHFSYPLSLDKFLTVFQQLAQVFFHVAFDENDNGSSGVLLCKSFEYPQHSIVPLRKTLERVLIRMS